MTCQEINIEKAFGGAKTRFCPTHSAFMIDILVALPTQISRLRKGYYKISEEPSYPVDTPEAGVALNNDTMPNLE
jgi:hypothetical protein